MDFTDAFPVSRANHTNSYSPGSTFLATVRHLNDDGGHEQFGRGTRQTQFAAAAAASSSSSSSSSSTAALLHSSSDASEASGLSTLIQVRVSATLQVVRSWKLAFIVVAVRWSQDGTKLLCAGKNRLVALIVDPRMAAASLHNDIGTANSHFFDKDDHDAPADCVLAIRAGAEGMASACWVGSDTVCTMSGDCMMATLLDVRTADATVVPCTKAASRCYVSPSHDYVAFLQRKDAADIITIMVRRQVNSVSGRAGWQLYHEFVAHSNDASNLVWSPDERYIAIWDGVLEYKLLIFSVLGHLQATITIDALQPVTSSQSPATVSNAPLSLSAAGLGIRDVRWSPDGRFIAIGDYHDHVRLLETKEWCECASFHMAVAASNRAQRRNDDGMYGWREPTGWQQTTGGRSIVGFEPINLPVALPVVKPDLDKLNPKAGICWMEWNATSERLAVRSESIPNAIFIITVPYDCDGMTRVPQVASVIVLSSPVSHAVWRPSAMDTATSKYSDELAIVCQSSAVYFWRAFRKTGEQAVEAIPIPIDPFLAVRLVFAPDGRILTLASTMDTFCCAIDAIEVDRPTDATHEHSHAAPSHL